jgi:hypothetical protein
MLDSAARFRAIPWRESQAVRVAQQMASRPAPGTSLPRSLARRTLGAALTCAAYATLGTVLWAAYGQPGGALRPVRPPLVTADATPIRVMPATAGQQQATGDAAIPATVAAPPESSPQPGIEDAGLVSVSRADRPPAGLAPAQVLGDQELRRALAALEALNGALGAPASSPLPQPLPELSDARPLAALSGTRDDARPQARSAAGAAPPIQAEPPALADPAEASTRTAAPLPALKPSDTAALVAAANPTAAPSLPPVAEAVDLGPFAPPLPAFKPERKILAAAGSPGLDVCGAAAARRGVLPRGCDVRLAEAHDESFLQSFWSSLRDLFSAGTRPAIVAADNGSQRSGVNPNDPGAGPDPSGGRDPSGAGNLGPTGGTSSAGGGATGAVATGNASVGNNISNTVASVSSSVSSAVGSVGASVGGGADGQGHDGNGHGSNGGHGHGGGGHGGHGHGGGGGGGHGNGHR